MSAEADVLPMNDEKRLSDLVDGNLGEGSLFHETYGYYAQGVDSRAPRSCPSGGASASCAFRIRIRTARSDSAWTPLTSSWPSALPTERKTGISIVRCLRRASRSSMKRSNGLRCCRSARLPRKGSWRSSIGSQRRPVSRCPSPSGPEVDSLMSGAGRRPQSVLWNDPEKWPPPRSELSGKGQQARLLRTFLTAPLTHCMPSDTGERSAGLEIAVKIAQAASASAGTILGETPRVERAGYSRGRSPWGIHACDGCRRRSRRRVVPLSLS
ncbi:hypothetical protein SAMN05444679_12573 [Variovorax sp. CF079]|nr:hypothetical protein SAMN05444679_12573 [Variovorax sp. CF079]